MHDRTEDIRPEAYSPFPSPASEDQTCDRQIYLRTEILLCCLFNTGICGSLLYLKIVCKLIFFSLE